MIHFIVRFMAVYAPSVGFLHLDKQIDCKKMYPTVRLLSPGAEQSAAESQAGNLPKFTFSTLWGLFSLNEELITMH